MILAEYIFRDKGFLVMMDIDARHDARRVNRYHLTMSMYCRFVDS